MSVNAHYLQGLARGVYTLLIRPINARQMSGIETVVSVMTLWSTGSDFLATICFGLGATVE